MLSITVFSSCKAGGKLCLDTAPIEFVEQDRFSNPNGFDVKEGLEVYSFLIRPSAASTTGINIRIEIDGYPYFRVIDGVLIQKSISYPITYSRQLELISGIKETISNTSLDSIQYIVTLYAKSGLGKSYVLKSIYSDFVLKHDMSIVTFEVTKQNGVNSILLCKILIFLNYGNVFWNQDIKTNDSINTFADLAVKYNTKSIFDDEMLKQIIKGCFDAEIAAKVIEDLMIHASYNGVLVQGNKTKLPRILLLDDFQYLDSRQAQFVSILCEQTINKRNAMIIISATRNKFRDNVTRTIFEQITPNMAELDGLSHEDKVITLQAAFDLPLKGSKAIADEILPTAPLLVSEVLRIISENKPKKGQSLDVISAYHQHRNSLLILTNRFYKLNDQYYLLDIIYRFKRGIALYLLFEYNGFEVSKLNYDIQRLFDEGLISKSDDYLFPYHDYYVHSYIQLRKTDFYNERTGEFLSYLLLRKYEIQCFDSSQLLSQLIRCDKRYLNIYEEDIKNTISANFFSTNFSTALYFCEYYYDQIKIVNIN